MMRCIFSRKWSLPCVLVGMLVLGLLAGLALQARSAAGASAEVVNAQPIRAIHAAGAAPKEAAQPYAGQARAGQARGGQPRVEIPAAFYDFGPISAQDVVRRDFLVINRGSADLVISQAYTTCGCTTAELSASVIPPGKASRVTVIFNAGYHPITTAPGGGARPSAVRRGLVLETNDPNHREVEIWVQASVGK